MTRANRVRPDGEVVADAARGLFMGNRGILHDAAGEMTAARWRHPHWIICQLAFKGRRRPLMAPGAYTELFFLDEPTALAAGHRPCAECRRQAFAAYAEALAGPRAADRPDAARIDRLLDAARLVRQGRGRIQMRERVEASSLPDGCMVLAAAGMMALRGRMALPWGPGGYGAPLPRPQGEVLALTPAPSRNALRGGYRPVWHPTAAAPA